MISEPLKYIDDFCKAGADIITFHTECDSPIDETIDKILANGVKASLTIKPKTPVEDIFPYLDKLSMVLVMTVEPGFGGQSFMADMLPKIKAIREEAEKVNPALMIQVDGGIVPETAKLCVEAGADVLVSGSYIFGAENITEAVNSLR
jgi:ribulose-phosphate 3-epimerase